MDYGSVHPHCHGQSDETNAAETCDIVWNREEEHPYVFNRIVSEYCEHWSSTRNYSHIRCSPTIWYYLFHRCFDILLLDDEETQEDPISNVKRSARFSSASSPMVCNAGDCGCSLFHHILPESSRMSHVLVTLVLVVFTMTRNILIVWVEQRVTSTE